MSTEAKPPERGKKLKTMIFKGIQPNFIIVSEEVNISI